MENYEIDCPVCGAIINLSDERCIICGYINIDYEKEGYNLDLG